MYLTMVSSFSNFLSFKNYTLQEILDHLVRVVFVPLDVRSIVYVDVNDLNELVVLGKSGISLPAASEIAPKYSLNDNYPVADAIRQKKIIWLPNNPETFKRYPLMVNFPLLIGDLALIIVPVFSLGVPVATLVLFSKIEIPNMSHLESFLVAISSVFSLYFYGLEPLLPNNPINPNIIKHFESKISPQESS